MKIYQVENDDQLWIVIAETKEEAKKIVKEDYFDEDEKPKLVVVEEGNADKGIVISYDYEDMYWHKK